jgi:putative SOS response-associated peptidase YedK
VCNLYNVTRNKEAIAELFRAQLPFEVPEVASHIYPRKAGYIIRRVDGALVLDAKTWGIPCRLKGKRPGTFVTNWVTNVRNLSSPFWRSALASPMNRCLVPFERFAEPRPGKDAEGRPAQWWFHLPGSEMAAFAGIWRPFTVEIKGEQVSGEAFAFLTCEPNPLVAPLHPKAMPVILHPEDYDKWLCGEADDACSLAAPFPSQLMQVT